MALDAVDTLNQLLDALERPGVVATLPVEDLTRVIDVLCLPIRALNNAVVANPALLDTLMRNIVDCFAAYERAIIGHRTRVALAQKIAKNERCGQIAFGKRLADDGIHLEPHPEEQKLLDIMRELRQSGLTLREAATAMNARGFRNRQGREWTHQFIATLLRTPR